MYYSDYILTEIMLSCKKDKDLKSSIVYEFSLANYCKYIYYNVYIINIWENYNK